MKFIYKFSIKLLVLFFAIGLQTAQAGEGKNTTTLHYDPATDKLSITANEVSQMKLFRHLALKTGLEVSYDEQADHPVTIELTAVSLVSGLKQLLRDSSHILYYGKDEIGNKLLVGVIVLPAGKSDRSSARRLLKREDEATHHARRQASKPSDSKVYDHTLARWGARLAMMSPEVQARLQKLAEEKLARELKKQAKQQKRADRKLKKAEKNKKREERRAKRLLNQNPQRQQSQDEINPEQHAEWEQNQTQLNEQRQARKEELRQQVYQQLQNKQ